MDESHCTPETHEYWECLYNHKHICEALVKEGGEVAQILFRQQVYRLRSLNCAVQADDQETAYVMLTTLNRSIYNYILFNLNISLSECCYMSRVHTHSISSPRSLIAAGELIISRYAKILKENEGKYLHFKNLCAYIQNHLEDDLTIPQVCSQLFISKSNLCRSFKELTGSTFCEYLKEQRIFRAKMLLLSTSMTMEDIAAKCGFKSPAYFSSVFKSETGFTPTLFRLKFQVHDTVPTAE